MCLTATVFEWSFLAVQAVVEVTMVGVGVGVGGGGEEGDRGIRGEAACPSWSPAAGVRAPDHGVLAGPQGPLQAGR